MPSLCRSRFPAQLAFWGLAGALAWVSSLPARAAQQADRLIQEIPASCPERETALASALQFTKSRDWSRLQAGYRSAKDPIAKAVWAYAMWRTQPGRGAEFLIGACRALNQAGISAGFLDSIRTEGEIPNGLIKFPGDGSSFGAESFIEALWGLAKQGNTEALDAVWDIPVDGALAEERDLDIVEFVVECPDLTLRWWSRFEPELGASVGEGSTEGYFSQAELEKAKKAYLRLLKPGDPRRARMLKWLEDPSAR